MDPMHREILTYSLQRLFESIFEDITHNIIEQSLAISNPEDFLSQALRYYKHCDLNPKAHQHETRLSEIVQRLDDKYGGFLKRNNLLQFTANENWLEEALKIPAAGSIRPGHYNDHATPANETPEDKRSTQLKWTIDSELEALTGVRKKETPVDLELLTFCPVTIERSNSLLKPFDYTERYSLHYILLREGSESEEAESEDDGASNSAGMDTDLPEPTSEDLTTQISVLRISGKKSNGEGGGVIKTAKKRAFDDSDDTDDAAASGYKRAKMEHWRERFKTF
ncbi:unnamed protein product [Fusarium fujikuroi]|nr:unnamed protein product [Fusarium fujikuroi]